MLAMPPGSLATTDDIVALCKIVAKHGGIYSSHIRNKGTGVVDAVKEAIAIGERAGVAGRYYPLENRDQRLWGRMNKLSPSSMPHAPAAYNVQAHV